MLNLIATVISVMLTLMMAGTGVYYGGSIFSANGGKVAAMNAVETLQQINLAWSAYAGDGGTTPTIANLTAGGTYLSSAPSPIGVVQPGAWFS